MKKEIKKGGPRPDFVTDAQRDEIVSAAADKIISAGLTDSERQSVLDDMAALYPFSNTGFEMAKSLELGVGDYSFDTGLIKILSSLDRLVERTVETNVSEWVSINDIKPKFRDGTLLRLVEDMPGTRHRRGDELYVNYQYTNKAIYVLDPNPKMRGGVLVPYEKVEWCCEAVEPLDRAVWVEIKARVRTFQLGDEPEVIYVIKRREDEYMVVMDDAHDITTGEVLHMNSADIMSKFGIDIKGGGK